MNVVIDRPRRSRIVDIAREAGVSTATVDRVLNGRAGVRGPTVERVIAVARKLAYPRNLPAAGEVVERRHVGFDVLLPSGRNTFIDELAEAFEAGGVAEGEFVAHGNVRRVPRLDPSSLAAALAGLPSGTPGVAFVAVEHPLVREATAGLVAQGIPVVTLVSDLSHSPRDAFVGVDNRAAGRTAGALLGRFTGGAAGPVAMLAGSMSYRGHEEREAGFRHILAEEFPRLVIVELREGQDDADRNAEQTREILARHPNLRGIYNAGAGSRGVAEALIEAGRGRDVVFIGHELTPSSRRYLVEGVMDAVVHQDPRHQGREALRLLLALHRDREARPLVERTPIEIFIRENLP